MNLDQIIQRSIDDHNANAARTNQDLEPWARLVAAAAIAALGAAALVLCATPCEDGHQCAGLLLAPAAHMRNTVRNALRGSWLHRAWVWPRAAYLRLVIRWAQDDVLEMEGVLRNEVRSGLEQLQIQAQIRVRTQWIAERQIQLIDIDLSTRAR